MSIVITMPRRTGADSKDPSPALDPHIALPDVEVVFDVIQSCEVSVDIRTKAQFEAWVRGPLHSLIPHTRFIIWAQGERGATEFLFRCESVGQRFSIIDAACSGPQLQSLRAAAGMWQENGNAPLLLDCSAWGDDLLAGAKAALLHGVRRLFGVRCIVLFGSDDALRLQDAFCHLELAVNFILLAALRVSRSAAGDAAERLRDTAAPKVPKVTAREARILECVRDGLSNAEIGNTLHISEFTVKSHLQRIFRKLGAANRTQAVATAIAHRYIRPVS